MRLDAGRGKLFDAHKTLRLRWEGVRETWGDANAQHFEQAVWEPLDQMTLELLRAVDRLNQVFVQVRNDCEGRR